MVLVHHAAPTAYHEDRLAEDFPEEAHGLSRNAGHYLAGHPAGALRCGDPSCPVQVLWTVSASASTPPATAIASLSCAPIANPRPSPSPSSKAAPAIKPSNNA